MTEIILPRAAERLRSEVARHPYPLVFATVSGAHLYGFPSADSDYDLRGCHVLPVREVVGLDTGNETTDLSKTDDVLELDLVTHDVKKFFEMLLKKNGYVLEQVYSLLVVHTTPEHEELKSICTLKMPIATRKADALSIAFTLDSGSGKGTFGKVTYIGNGEYQATFMPSHVGTYTIEAEISGVKVKSTATLTVTAG